MILFGTFINKTKFIKIGQQKPKPTRACNKIFLKTSAKKLQTREKLLEVA